MSSFRRSCVAATRAVISSIVPVILISIPSPPFQILSNTLDTIAKKKLSDRRVQRSCDLLERSRRHASIRITLERRDGLATYSAFFRQGLLRHPENLSSVLDFVAQTVHLPSFEPSNAFDTVILPYLLPTVNIFLHTCQKFLMFLLTLSFIHCKINCAKESEGRS